MRRSVTTLLLTPARWSPKRTGRLFRNVLLTLLLLLAQQGALWHELSHFGGATQSRIEGGSQHLPAEPCDLCLEFAPLAFSAGPTAVMQPLLLQLVFAWLRPAPRHDGSTQLPAQRNRGPPAYL